MKVTKQQKNRARAIVQRARVASEVAEKRRLIGRCYKYQNRFSDGEMWWLYAVVTAVDEHGRLIYSQVQHNSMDGISLSPDTYGDLLPHGGWTPISQAEFKAATVAIAAEFLARLALAQSVAAVDPVDGRVTA